MKITDDLTAYAMLLKKARCHADIVEIVSAFDGDYQGIPGYSFGHIVIDDYNFEGDSIVFCLDPAQIKDWEEDHPDRAHLSDTIKAFLELLLTVPEEYRLWDDEE